MQNCILRCSFSFLHCFHTEEHICQPHHLHEYCEIFYSWNVWSLKVPFHTIFFFNKTPTPAFHPEWNNNLYCFTEKWKPCLTFMKRLLLSPMSPQPIPQIAQEHQTLKTARPWGFLETPSSDCLFRLVCYILRLPGLSAAGKQNHRTSGCLTQGQAARQDPDLWIGFEIWQRPPCNFVVTMFSQNILVFYVILALKSWEVFREI